MLYKKIELEEGIPMLYLGAYIARWTDGVCYDPEMGFVEATKEDLEKALENSEYLE